MTYKPSLRIVLATIASTAIASAAIAGGNTIAYSAKTSSVAALGVRTLASGLSNLDDDGADVCATIVNRSAKNAVIQLTLTDFEATTSSSQIAKSKSSALCLEKAESVAVTCLGPSKCSFTWSIDLF